MSSLYLLQSFLLFHLIGFMLFAGATVADFVAFRQFWKQYGPDKTKAAAMLQSMVKFPVLMRIGIITIVLTGIGMMAVTHGAFGEQLWFRIKFGLVIIIILNGVLVGRRQGVQLRKIAEENTHEAVEKVQKIRSNLSVFHTIQFTLFFIIVLLSVFKFN